MTAYEEYKIARANAKKINKVFYEMSEEEADDFVEYSGLLVWNFNREEYKKGYNKLRPIMKKYGWTVKMIRDWRELD